MTLREERGAALVGAVGVLSAMTALATLSLMAGGTDLAIATRQARARSAFYAAESALAEAVEELGSASCPVPSATFEPPWPDPAIAVRRWRDGAWSCSRRVGLIADVADADGDPATTVVLFNRAFGYASSPRRGGGPPVVQVRATASTRESGQAIVAEVVPLTCAPELAAAWTAAGPVELSGEVEVSGGGGYAALAGRSPARLSGVAALAGEQIVDPALALPADVVRLLNAGGTLARLEELDEPAAGRPLHGMIWSRGDYAGTLDGDGILVVHNPAFDPVKHEASRLAAEEGIVVEGLDPGYSHLDPARQPARLEILSGGSFSGLIVADTIGSANVAFTLSGALVTLSRSSTAVSALFPLRVQGSPAAVARAGRGPLRHVVGFRPLPAAGGEHDRNP